MLYPEKSEPSLAAELARQDEEKGLQHGPLGIESMVAGMRKAILAYNPSRPARVLSLSPRFVCTSWAAELVQQEKE